MLTVAKQLAKQVFTRTTVALWLLISLALAVAGPFGTFLAMPAVERFIYWAVIVAVSIVLSVTGRRMAGLLTRPEQKLLNGLIVATFVTLFLTPLVWVMSVETAALNLLYLPPPGVLLLYVFFISVSVTVIRRVASPLYGYFSGPEAETPPENTERARLVARLPQPVDGLIVRLTVRDHFVDVVTTKGTETLRMRLADAIKEMEPIAGSYTHRSHWVAYGMIKQPVRDHQGRQLLEMVNGDLVPVGRKFKPVLDEAGIL